MNKNLFIIESDLGEHHKVDDRFQADILSFTFLPVVNSIIKNKILDNFSSLMPKRINPIKFNRIYTKIDNVSNFIKTNNYDKIFIATDLDITGNAMARIIYDYLLFNKIDKNRIIRIPLTSDGFKYICDFWDNNSMFWWLKTISEEMEYVYYSRKVTGKTGVGRRIPLILNEIVNAPVEVENLNLDGTSSITYIFKKAIKEK